MDTSPKEIETYRRETRSMKMIGITSPMKKCTKCKTSKPMRDGYLKRGRNKFEPTKFYCSECLAK